MRAFSRNSDAESLTLKNVLPQARDLPSISIEVSFRLRAGHQAQPQKWTCLVDTGAAMTFVPEFWVGIYGGRHLASGFYMDPEIITIRGGGGLKRVPAYQASVSINGRALQGPWNDGRFIIAAVPHWPYPVVGRDILSRFLTIINPWNKTTAIAGGFPGKIEAGALAMLRGRAL